MISSQKFFAIVMVGSLVGCDDSGYGRTESIVLNHYQQECHQLFARLCVLRQAGSPNQWELSYAPYVGLDYQWGYIHEFDARYKAADSGIADATGKYKVSGAVRRTAVAPGTVFDIRITEPDGIQVLEPGQTYELYRQKSFSCTPDQCQTIAALLEQQQSILFEFMHAEEPAQPLVLTQIKCADSRETFLQTCLMQ